MHSSKGNYDRFINSLTHRQRIEKFIADGVAVSGGSAGAATLTPQQTNALQRQAVLAGAVEMTQQIYSATFPLAANANPINIPPRNVGLLKKFVVEITANIATNAGAVLSQLGLANCLAGVQFTDLQNNQRINTDGVHLAAIADAKKRRPAQQTLSTVVADNNQMLQHGENFPVLTYVSPASAPQVIRAVFEVPICYSDDDLRGAIYMNVVNATANLQLSIVQNAVVAAGVDSTYALFGSGASTIPLTNITVTVYQVYLDQIPQGKNGPILPILDLSTVYELKKTNFNSITAGQDFPIAFANFRDFVSVFAVLNSTGADAGLLNGSDVNYWALQSANFTNIWKLDPLEVARRARNEIQVDFPKGMYYFPSRRHPISTITFGNMQLILNAKTASAPAYMLIYWEDFGYTNTLTKAGSLAG